MQDELTRYFSAEFLNFAWDNGGDFEFESVPELAHTDSFTRVRGKGDNKRILMNLADRVGDLDATIMAMQTICMWRFMRSGPVIIRPSVEICEALKDTELRLGVYDYHSPFEIMGVELPKSIAGDFYPCITMVWKFAPHAIFTWTMPNNGITYHGRFGPDMTIEERLLKSEGVECEEDRALMVVGSRIAMNLCMLAGQYKTTTTPLPQRVFRHRNGKDERLQRLAGRHFQEVSIRELIIQRPPISEPISGVGGWTLRPHRRRGHWKRVPYGEKATLRKWNWISDYIVHKEAFQSDTIILKDSNENRP